MIFTTSSNQKSNISRSSGPLRYYTFKGQIKTAKRTVVTVLVHRILWHHNLFNVIKTWQQSRAPIPYPWRGSWIRNIQTSILPASQGVRCDANQLGVRNGAESGGESGVLVRTQSASFANHPPSWLHARWPFLDSKNTYISRSRSVARTMSSHSVVLLPRLPSS